MMGKGIRATLILGGDKKIIEKLKKPMEVVLFFELAGETDVIVLLKEDIDWDF